jgi:hypothetical protein
MPELHFDRLVAPAASLVRLPGIFFGAERFLRLNPRLKQGRGVEDALELAENLSGGQSGRLVNCYA